MSSHADASVLLVSSDVKSPNDQNHPLGDLIKIPLELRRKIYGYVLDLCSPPKKYLKGQEKNTGNETIRTGILMASKDMYAEARPVIFSSNQFCLYGFRKLGLEDSKAIGYEKYRKLESWELLDRNIIPENRKGYRSNPAALNYYMVLALSKAERSDEYKGGDAWAEPLQYDWMGKGCIHGVMA